MDTEAFVAWALDDARTPEQRLTIEVFVDQGIRHWNAKRKIYDSESLETFSARQRERELNPAYAASYNEEGLRQTAESLGDLKNWWPSSHSIVNLDVLPFFSSLEWVWIHQCRAPDLSPLARLPALRKLLLGSLGSDFGSGPCEDYTFLGRCSSLREITLGFGATWPDFSGFEALSELQLLEISGNLSALPRDLTFPKVGRAKFYSRPLYARNVAELPHLPACQSLTLSGTERLDGIEGMPGLRNLTLLGHCRSFAPLAALTELTWLKIEPSVGGDAEKLPRDITPIAALPRLRFFEIGPRFDVWPDMPRDYAPLAEAPALRELSVLNCSPVQMEVDAIRAGLLPWDDVFLLPEPRPLTPSRMIMASSKQQPDHRDEQTDPGDSGLIDLGLRECEGRWAKEFAHRVIAERIGHGDWGTVDANALHRTLNLSIESFDVVEQLPEIIEATREVIARLRPDYIASFGIYLKVKPPQLTPAQQLVEDKWRQQQDEEDWEQRRRDKAEYLERLHELELKKQQGLEINPADFSPLPYGEMAKTPAGSAPEDDDEPEFQIDENDDGEDDGDIAIATDHDPDVDIFSEHDHPLYSNYLCAGTV
ncbi:MAG TPA: hypothetical protein VHW03_06020, partial [Chthoniobacterales bacterium]|nr:hypothetical protein [Chthoniobacterales bacterium]